MNIDAAYTLHFVRPMHAYGNFCFSCESAEQFQVISLKSSETVLPLSMAASLKCKGEYSAC